MIGMARILTWLIAVKVVTAELDAMAAKSDPSVGNNHKYIFAAFVREDLTYCRPIVG